MSNSHREFKGRVAIVTGAGRGLGRAHAALLASCGARVVVNDLDADAIKPVVEEINARGGQAIGIAGSVADQDVVQEIVARTLFEWSKIDILINNAGILRDKTFAKMDLADFRLVIDVHLMGSVLCTKAVWPYMRRQNYGRVVMTTSSSGLYGNFGQSNYSAAKMALVGLMQTLALEGARNNIRVNCIAPSAASQMSERILPQSELDFLKPELVSPGVLALVTEDAPTKVILCAGAGSFEVAHITLTSGIKLDAEGAQLADQVAAAWDRIADRAGEIVPGSGEQQAREELKKAGYSSVPPR